METNSSWRSTLNTRPDMVFQEVIAILTAEYLYYLCKKPDEILANLTGEIDGIKVEKFDMDDGNTQFHIRGSLEHILLFKIKIEKMMADKYLKNTAMSATDVNKSKLNSVKQLPSENDIVIKQEVDDEPKEIMTRSKRKVLKPRKVSHDVYTAENQDSEDGNRCEDRECSERMEASKNLPSNSSETSNSPVLHESIEIKPENFLEVHLEVEAEKKAEEWLSIPNFVANVKDTNPMPEPLDVSNSSYTQPTIYSCELCYFKAEREGQFLKHVLTHSKHETVHQCRKCPFASVSLSHYNRHQLTHSDATFNCPECDFTSDDPKVLARHVTIKHTIKENPLKRSSLLQCNNCPYNTTKIYHFERHLLVHNRDLKGLLQVHQCDQCPYKTHRKEHIVRHRHNVHIRHRPYSCNSCHRSYKNMEGLQQHFNEAHSEVLKQ